MYPAVVIQHFALYTTACLTVDRVSKILLGHAYDARTEEQSHRDPVMQPEHKVVDGDDICLDHGLDVAGDIHHDVTVSPLCPRRIRRWENMALVFRARWMFNFQ